MLGRAQSCQVERSRDLVTLFFLFLKTSLNNSIPAFYGGYTVNYPIKIRTESNSQLGEPSQKAIGTVNYPIKIRTESNSQLCSVYRFIFFRL